MTRSPSHALSSKKLLQTKWTAVTPRNKEKHFLVTKVIEPEPPGSPVVRDRGRAFEAHTRHCLARTQGSRAVATWMGLTTRHLQNGPGVVGSSESSICVNVAEVTFLDPSRAVA